MFQCACGKTYTKQSSLSSHARFCDRYEKKTKPSQYKKDGSYNCECGKAYSSHQSLNAHFSHCPIHREGKLSLKNRGGGGWSKGLTKEDHSGIARMAIAVSKNRKGKAGVKHTDETKKRLSEKRIDFLENNPNHNIKWHVISNGSKNIKVQGEWELTVAQWLNSKSISWDRVKINFDNYRTYTPDFFLKEYNCYIEVKGWLRDRDIQKMRKVIEETGIKIKLLSKELYYRLDTLTLDDIDDFY